MSEVAWVFGSFFDEVRARGISPEKLTEGLGLPVEPLRFRHQRISWDAFVELARRTEELLGDTGFGELAARSALRSVPGLLRRALHRVDDVRPLYLVGARWWGPWIFRSTRATCEELPDGRLRQVIEILPDYRESPAFFRGVQALLRVMPRLLELPEAVVELRHDGRRGEFVIAPPPGRKRRRWRRKASLKALPEEFRELGFQQEQLRESERRAQASAALLASTSRRLDTLGSLQRLLPEARDLRHLVRSIVRLIQEDFLTAGVRISLHPGFVERDASALYAATGQVAGAPTLTVPLKAADGEIGALEVWSHSEEGLLPDETRRLADLGPWIAVVLINAQAGDTIHAFQRESSQAREAVQPGESNGDQATPVEVRLNDLGPELAAQLDGGPVLLVDTDDIRRGLIEAFFEEAGFEVAWAGSDPTRIPVQVTASALLIADWGRSQDTAFMAEMARLRPNLRGLLLLPLEQL